MMHFSPPKTIPGTCWRGHHASISSSFLFSSPTTSQSPCLSLSSLSRRASLSQLGTDGRIQQMFYLAVFSFFVCVHFLLSVFSLLLLFVTFAHLSCCRMDLGWEVNEVICICPKLFAVDCFEGRTTGKREKKTLTAGRMYKNRAKRKKTKSHCILKLLFTNNILDKKKKITKITKLEFLPADKHLLKVRNFLLASHFYWFLSWGMYWYFLVSMNFFMCVCYPESEDTFVMKGLNWKLGWTVRTSC